MRKILILVESNTTGTGREFVRRAAEMGAEPVLITADPGRYGYVAADGVPYVIADTSDNAELLAAARSLAADSEVAGVTSSSDYFVLAAAVLARARRLPGPLPDAVRDCQHKGTQRQLLAAAGLPGPRYAIAETEDDALVSARRMGFPVVVKPVQGSGSFGVRLCATGDELVEHVGSLLARGVNERNMKIIPGALVEEYIDAQEFSVEIFHGSVAAIVRKHLGNLPYFVEIGHDIPSGLSASDEARLGKFAMEAVRSLGLTWGAVHVEVRMQGSRMAVVEVNARLAGGMIPELLRRCCGADLVRLQVGAALGRAVEASRADNVRAASIRFLVAEQNATLREPGDAIAKVRSLPGVADAIVYKAANEYVAPAVDFRGRIGHVLTISGDAATACRTADEYATMLRDEILAPVPSRSTETYQGSMR
jgi:S-sulfo-L-cysteine synthase (3-phospho-L-serine-dependent)